MVNSTRCSIAVAAGIWLSAVLPVTTQAQTTGEATLGAAVVKINHPSAYFGQYNGLTDDGFYFIGGLRLHGDGRYFNLNADVLGEDQRSMNASGGSYGSYNIKLRHDEFPSYISTESATPLLGVGSTTLSLPAGFVKGKTTGAMSTLQGDLKPVELGVKRNNNALDFSWALPQHLDLGVHLRRYEKHGLQSLGGTVGTAGSPANTQLPAPVDYATNEMGLDLSYIDKAGDWRLGYTMSTFTDANRSLVWDVPFLSSTSTAYPATARISLPPDNQQYRFTLGGGLNLPYATRLAATVETGGMSQDVALLPYDDAGKVVVPPPRTSAEAQIRTTHALLTLASRPLPGLGIDARLRRDIVENNTPSDLFRPVINDTTAQVAQNAVDANYNLPYGYAKNSFNLDGSYYLGRGTTMVLGYDRDAMGLSYRSVAKTTENTYRAELRSHIDPLVSIKLKYAHANRGIDGSYDENSVYNAFHTQEYINSITPAANRFEVAPDMRQFDIAERRRKLYRVGLDITPTPTVLITVDYQYTNDDYDHSVLGLSSNRDRNVSADFGYTPNRDLSFDVFFNHVRRTPYRTAAFSRSRQSPRKPQM